MVPSCASLQNIFDLPLITPITSWKHMDNKYNPCMNAESLSMCTEGLGFESFDDVERLKYEDEDVVDHDDQCFDAVEKHAVSEILVGESKRSRMKGMEFPPPISSIGLSGKPWTCLQSYRSNGRFILREVRIPTQELLHACREDGRLKLQFIQSDDEPLYEEDDDDEEEEDDERLNVDLDGDYVATRKPEITVTP
ncbi:putative The fantastic four family protein [Helianthus annuus]|uniref:Putative the fantastic four family n=1 Tax=Helianthus annuus TaxID=4232 RepID=A0A251T6V1_HELAN|nr:protein FAF-like, chloroplastic [Helianthus annuus]KAF5768706.1 putative The fantastic four family protein [Helianthus annuus]KAJ0463893.1 putative The fantastic four family protein [Helianthus annuus]KAJ0468214.1 putative The fantastic four family protein [Helianthus annuus]KAJ0485397.1 putative The fantastic four family protein [Helianthus annuus]KAJ0655948.1 putative The fantastic four family protein [Helianthus annuus]